MKTKAKFYNSIKEDIHCYLCPHNCIIKEGNVGKCNVRLHEKGELYTLNYGDITALSLDPIEKKPLHYFKPSSQIISVGSYGCNMTCTFCQNYNISQTTVKGKYIPKEDLVDMIINTKDNIGIAFTYNEPSIWYEYIYDVSKLLKSKDNSSSVVLVTNGFISEEPLKELLPYVDAMNIDLKSFNQNYYKKICGASLKPVLNTIELAAKSCHIEVTTLLVSGENDSLEEIELISKFLSELDKTIPLHLSRYFPRYKMDNPATDINFMLKAKETADKYLDNIKLGNV
ncbi:MAG: AmmeMemoRadiSam system radical SAM enzyme [Eubacteriales bacterium]